MRTALHSFVPAYALAGLLTLGLNAQSSDTSMGVFPWLVGDMDSQIGQVVNDCVARNLDTVYVSAFRATGPQSGTLWISDPSGTWNPAWGPVRPGNTGIDLRAFIQAAHAQDLRVVAVLKCFESNAQPTDAGHRSYLLNVIDWLANRYDSTGAPWLDLDGVALDYVRYVGAGSGNDPTPVTNFVRDAKALLGARSLHAYLIANRYTFDGPVYNTSFNSYQSVIAQLSSDYGQHWEQMALHVDVMMPMCYTADGSIYNTAAAHQAYVQTAASYCRAACNRVARPFRRVTPVIKTYTSSGETTTPQTVEASIQGALAGGGDGFQGFRYATVQASWWQKLEQYSVPGQNWPVPVWTAMPQGLAGSFDTSASRDQDQGVGSLEMRFDVEGDGVFETAWSNNALPLARLMRHPGTWRVDVQLRDAQGHVSASSREFTVGDVMTVDSGTYFASLGGPYVMRVDLGPLAAGMPYLFIGSLTGPGTSPWRPGYDLPIVWDSISEGLLGAANSPLFLNAQGVLDANGRATATLQIPPGVLSGLAWQRAYWAAAGFDALGLPLYVTNSKSMLILP